jgi:UMF1 family MFS transporter
MGPDQTNRTEARQYEDEDIRTTSKQELRGFYMYGWAAEVNMQSSQFLLV